MCATVYIYNEQAECWIEICNHGTFDNHVGVECCQSHKSWSIGFISELIEYTRHMFRNWLTWFFQMWWELHINLILNHIFSLNKLFSSLQDISHWFFPKVFTSFQPPSISSKKQNASDTSCSAVGIWGYHRYKSFWSHIRRGTLTLWQEQHDLDGIYTNS